MELTEGNQSSFTKCKSSFISPNRITRACAPDSKDSEKLRIKKKQQKHDIFKQRFSRNSAFIKFQNLWETD